MVRLSEAAVHAARPLSSRSLPDVFPIPISLPSSSFLCIGWVLPDLYRIPINVYAGIPSSMKRKRAEQTTGDVVRTVRGPKSLCNSNLLKERHVNEDSLVGAERRGHRAVFDQLCEHSSRKVLRATYRITRNQEDAEDALQDAFLKAFVHLKNFDGRSNFTTWLTRIAINSSLMILRKRRQGREISVNEFADRSETGLVWEVSDPTPGPETHYAQQEREKLLWGAIGELRPSLRKVVEFQLSRDCPMEKT